MKEIPERRMRLVEPVEPRNTVSRDPKQLCDALVLDAKLRQSLVTVRSLGYQGIRVSAQELEEKGPRIPTFSSRWCQRGYAAPSYEQGTELYLAHLEELLDCTGARVVILSSDGTLAVLRQHRERLERRVGIALAKEPALGIAINKEQTLEIAEHLGIAIPRGIHVRSARDVPEVLREIGLPAVVKPVESWLWGDQQEKAARLICELVISPDEARRAVDELTALGGTVLFQQFLSGEREAVSFLYAHGEMYARFAQWAKRTQPPLGGTSVFRRSIVIPQDIGDQAERLVREIGLEGYSEVEFRRDGAGKPYLMEINPRLSASVEVAVRSGVDFPYLLYQWAAGDHIDRVEGYRAGGWMRYLEGDILTTVQSFTQRGRPGVTPPARALYDFFASFFIPAGYDYVDWRDPRPIWTAALDFGWYVRHRLGRSLERSKSK